MSLTITILLLGVVASLSPSTLVVFILLLATTRARVNAAAFLIGWTISLVFVFAVSFELGSTHVAGRGSARTAVDAVEILLGVTLILAAVRQWGRRDQPRNSSRVGTRFTARLKRLNPWEAMVVGVLEQPWTLTAAAAVVVVRDHTALFVAVIAFVVFTVVSTATVGLIYLYYARRPGDAEEHLSDLRDRVVRAGPVLFAAVSLLVGAYLVVDGITALV